MSQPSDVDPRNLFQRLHAVMEACDYIQKEKKEGMKYTIVSHDAVTAYVRPELVKNRVIYYPVKINRTQEGNRTQVDAVIRFVNIDNPSEFMDVESCGYGIDPQDKGPGKAISYSVKYALLKALGLETGDEPDEHSIAHDPRAKPAPSSVEIDAQRKAKETAAATFKSAIEMAEDLDELGAWCDEHWQQIDVLPKDLNAEVIRAMDARNAHLSKSAIKTAKALPELGAWWMKHLPLINALPEAMKAEIIKAKDERKAQLSKPALQAAE